MHIDLGRGDRFMPQHKLYRPQIGAIFKQVRSKRVPKCMRTYGFGKINASGQVFYNSKYHSTCKPPAPPV